MGPRGWGNWAGPGRRWQKQLRPRRICQRRALALSGAHCRWRFSLTFSKIETESLVSFTKSNQGHIGDRCASGSARDSADFLNAMAPNWEAGTRFRRACSGTGKSCVCDSGGSGAEQPARSSALTPAPSQASLRPQGGVLSSARGVPSEHSCPSQRVWGTALSSGIRRRRRRGSGARVGSPRPAAGSADTQRRHTVPFTRPGTRGKELCPAGRPRSS